MLRLDLSSTCFSLCAFELPWQIQRRTGECRAPTKVHPTLRICNLIGRNSWPQHHLQHSATAYNDTDNWAVRADRRGRRVYRRGISERASLRDRDLLHRRGRGVLRREEDARGVNRISHRWTLINTDRTDWRLQVEIQKNTGCYPVPICVHPWLPRLKADNGEGVHSPLRGIRRFVTSHFLGRRNFTIRRRSTGCSAGRRGREKPRRCFTKRFTRRTSIRAWTRCCCGGRFRSLRLRSSLIFGAMCRASCMKNITKPSTSSRGSTARRRGSPTATPRTMFTAIRARNIFLSASMS